MWDGIVEIKVFSAALFVTAAMLISHYQSTDCPPPPEGIKAFKGFRADCIGNTPTHSGNLSEKVLTGTCWYRKIL